LIQIKSNYTFKKYLKERRLDFLYSLDSLIPELSTRFTKRKISEWFIGYESFMKDRGFDIKSTPFIDPEVTIGEYLDGKTTRKLPI
jgi:hypothetical protein